MLPISACLTGWHDFYALVGAASATLVGLLFVAASIGAGIFTRENQVGIRTFLSPTVAHFTAVLIMCLLATIPAQTWAFLGVLEALAGATGFAYSLWIWRRMIVNGLITNIDLADRFWYAMLPIMAYLLVIAAAIGILQQSVFSLNVLAMALLLLLLTGIRNAWDMTIWAIDHRPS